MSLLRRSSLVLPLFALFGCADGTAPTAVSAPEGPSFDQVSAGPVVNSLADPGDGTCDDTECTLREAIAFASPGATITFSVTGTISISGRNSPFHITKTLSIVGPGAAHLTLNGNSTGTSVIYINVAGGTVSLSGLTITGGGGDHFGIFGGGIFAEQGSLTVDNSVITGNRAGWGGGIALYGTALIIRNSTVSNNTGSELGGGVFGAGTERTIIENSTISGNRGAVNGGGILAGWLTLTNSTVSGNSATESGGGVETGEMTSTITHSTIAGNTAPLGSGIRNRGDLTLRNSIVANLGTGADCASTFEWGNPVFTDGGYNLVQDGSCLDGASTSFSGDPRLGELADNGGPTWTHALLNKSTAIDAIPFGSNGCGLSTDQRGVTRPQNGACDIGSFEFARGGGGSKGGGSKGGSKK